MYNEMPVFDYEDIQLIPNKCIISSRSEADTQVTLGDYTFKLPVIPANMHTFGDRTMTAAMAALTPMPDHALLAQDMECDESRSCPGLARAWSGRTPPPISWEPAW